MADRDKICKEEKTCISIIVQSIHDNQLEYIIDKKTAKEMTDSLKQVFERKSIASQLLLRKQLLTMKYSERSSISEYFLVFDKRIRELKSIGANMEEADIICHLLLTLPTSFDNLVTALETMNSKDLSMEFVKARLLDEYNKRNGQINGHEKLNESLAMNLKSNMVCYHCGKHGHKKAKCFKLKNKINFNKSKFNKNGDANNVSTSKQVLNKTSDVAVSLNADSDYKTKSVTKDITSLNASMIIKSEVESDEIKFILDSGATEHMVNDATCFNEIFDVENINISVAKKNEKLIAKQQGEINISTMYNGDLSVKPIRNVLYVHDLKCNLLSIPALTKKGFKIIFDGNRAFAKLNGKTIFVAKLNGKLYEVVFRVHRPNFTGIANNNDLKFSQNLWHFRLGHLNAYDMKRMIKYKMISGIENVNVNTENKFCESCIVSKHTRSSFPQNSNNRSNRILELIHSDVCGPISKPAWDGSRYFVTFTDDYSRASMVYCIERKSDVFNNFKKFVAMAESLHGCKIAKLKVDNGGEYSSMQFKEFCERKGIQLIYTVPYNPEMNSVAERLNRTFQEKALTMLTASGLERRFWNEAIMVANFIKNRSPTKVFGKQFKTKTPAEIWYGSKPNLSHIKIFGAICYNHVPAENRRKLEQKSNKCVFLGYSSSHGSYRLWNLESNKLVIGRNVFFDENSVLNKNRMVTIVTETTVNKESSNSNTSKFKENSDDFNGASKQSSDVEENNYDTNIDGIGDFKENIHIVGKNSTEDIVRRTTRESRKPERFGNFMVPGQYKDQWIEEDVNYALSAADFIEGDPVTIEEAKQRIDWPMWKNAIDEEYTSLLRNNTWNLCDLPKGRKTISSKWIFKLKRKANGEIDKYKVRLVARGFTQEKGFDYNETYSPTAKLTTFRILLSISLHYGYFIHQMDVKCAFLNGVLDEEIYMQQPHGFIKDPTKVCKLQRSLYGLKQASRMWNERFNQFIIKLGFKRCLSDQCLYTKIENSIVCYILLYVDDLLIISNDIDRIKIIKQLLSKEFEMTDIGEVDTFLGIQIQYDRTNNMISMSQPHYLKGMIKKFNMQCCKGAATPMERNIDLVKDKKTNCDNVPYRELIGCLTYATITTRPDLCSSTNYFSRFQSCFKEEHFNHAKRNLRYIQSTLDLKMVYHKKENVETLVGYTDADWAGDRNDRKSTSGYVFKVFGNTVSWSSRKQATVSLSSTEAEYISLSHGICEAKWIHMLLDELGINCSSTIIYVDNQSCIRVAEEPRDHKRMKHIDVKLNFIRESIKSKEFQLMYIPSGDQLADIMTKGLGKNLFVKHRNNLNLI